MRHLPTIARILLGLVFFVFGLNGFLHFIPQPKEALPDLIEAMVKAGYMLPLIAGTEVVAGALLLLNRFVPLALALLAPVIVNIFAFHLFLVPSGMVIAIVVALLEIYLAWTYRNSFHSMLAARVTPGGAPS